MFFLSYGRMITGYSGFYGEQENQGYYVGADAMDFQYPVSFLSCFFVMIIVLLWFSIL